MSSPRNIIIEKIDISSLVEVAAILTDAFETNPAYALIFEDKKHNLREGLLWLFKTNLFLINNRELLTHVIKEKDSGKIIGCYTLIPPGGVKSALSDYTRIGLFGFIRKFGFNTLRKMMGMDSFNKELLNKAIGTNQYYYLSMVALKKECRGSGIGSFAMKNCLKELAKEKRNCNLLGLTTQLPENVSFYSKLGFEKIDEGEMLYKQHTYYNYNMKFDL